MKFQTPKGTRDLLPQEARKYQIVTDIIRKVYQKYGFRPLDTPAFESFGLFAAKGGVGEAVKDEIYYFKDKSKRELALRFEFTASLARVISNNIDIPKPFKRYQIGKVWRYDKPQALRWREFWQADADIIGSDIEMADNECLNVAVECLKELGFKKFTIRINDRRLTEEILFSFGIPMKQMKDAFRIIDKLDKIGLDGVKKELAEKEIDSKKIVKMLSIKGTNAQMLKKLSEYKDIRSLRSILRCAKNVGIDKYLKIDLSLVRGLEYYTGAVFEISLGADVSCGGGGRYDKLIETMGGPDLPAVGISFGIDRVISVMTRKGMFDNISNDGVFLVAVNDTVRDQVMGICNTLRSKGITSEYDIMNRSLSKQLQYANSLKFPFVAILGEKELKKKSVNLRNMKTGSQKLVKIKDL
ncbi:MAG: histidine--tRNA ligase, partial [Candidatus Aenigmarchaeota archaeon]|nr:histidine--tRNA ligase [Candidatus Aenigmarchaeota archaeon]